MYRNGISKSAACIATCLIILVGTNEGKGGAGKTVMECLQSHEIEIRDSLADLFDELKSKDKELETVLKASAKRAKPSKDSLLQLLAEAETNLMREDAEALRNELIRLQGSIETTPTALELQFQIVNLKKHIKLKVEEVFANYSECKDVELPSHLIAF